MATGYDYRGNGRDTFAPGTTAPVQGGRGATANASRLQVVGGASSGVGVAAGPQTDAGPVAAGLGTYFATLMEPHVARKEQEQFFKGFTAAQSGLALAEIDKSNKGLGKIFGPSAYEEGANFYTAKTALNEWQASMLTQTDELKKLHPDELAKQLAEQSSRLMTGHASADQIIQAGVLEASGPMLNTIAKARFGWQQEEAVRAQSGAAHSGAGALQVSLVQQAALTDPSDEQTAAARNSISSFLSSMAKPDGMTEGSYKGFLTNFMTKAMQDGNFYAVEAMKRAGITSVLDDEATKKIDDAYVKYGNKILGKAALGEAPELIALDTAVKMGKIKPNDAAAQLATINNRLKATTGIDLDLFDYKDIRGIAGSVTDVALASLRRAEARGWQVEDRERNIEAGREEDAAENDAIAAQVSAMVGMGATEDYVLNGGKRSDADLILSNAYRSGDYGMLITNFQNGGTVSSPVAKAMQAKVTSSDEYTKDFEVAYQEWSTMYGQSASAAKAYYGDQNHTSFQSFDRLKRGGTSNLEAYRRSFADPTLHGVTNIPAGIRRETNELILDYVSSQGWQTFNPFSWGNPRLNDSSARAVTKALSRHVAIAMKNSDLTVEQATVEQAQVMRANGSLEQYGSFAWENRPGTPKLYNIMGLKEAEANTVFTKVLDKRLKAAGAPNGASGDTYGIIRAKDPEGKMFLSVYEHESGKQILLREDELKAAATAHVKAKITPTPKARVTTKAPDRAAYDAALAKAKRRIPGETGLARTSRINREMKPYGIPKGR